MAGGIVGGIDATCGILDAIFGGAPSSDPSVQFSSVQSSPVQSSPVSPVSPVQSVSPVVARLAVIFRGVPSSDGDGNINCGGGITDHHNGDGGINGAGGISWRH